MFITVFTRVRYEVLFKFKPVEPLSTHPGLTPYSPVCFGLPSALVHSVINYTFSTEIYLWLTVSLVPYSRWNSSSVNSCLELPAGRQFVTEGFVKFLALFSFVALFSGRFASIKWKGGHALLQHVMYNLFTKPRSCWLRFDIGARLIMQ